MYTQMLMFEHSPPPCGDDDKFQKSSTSFDKLKCMWSKSLIVVEKRRVSYPLKAKSHLPLLWSGIYDGHGMSNCGTP